MQFCRPAVADRSGHGQRRA